MLLFSGVFFTLGYVMGKKISWKGKCARLRRTALMLCCR
jgi:hypothetical protein